MRQTLIKSHLITIKKLNRAKRWIAAMLGRYSTKSILHNIFGREFYFENLAFKHIVDFFERIEKYLINNYISVYPESIMMVAHEPPYLYLKGKEIVDKKERVSTVIQVAELIRYFTKRLDEPISDDTQEEKIWKEIQDGNITANELTGIIKGESDFRWVTKTKDIEILRENLGSEELATKIRNLLGLKKYENEVYLVEIVYPENFSDNFTLVIPTFLDAIDYCLFRSHKSKDGWGRTINLSNFNDGLSEAVHKACEITSEFKIVPIGKVIDTSPLINYRDLYSTFCTATKNDLS